MILSLSLWAGSGPPAMSDAFHPVALQTILRKGWAMWMSPWMHLLPRSVSGIDKIEWMHRWRSAGSVEGSDSISHFQATNAASDLTLAWFFQCSCSASSKVENISLTNLSWRAARLSLVAPEFAAWVLTFASIAVRWVLHQTLTAVLWRGHSVSFPVSWNKRAW